MGVTLPVEQLVLHDPWNNGNYTARVKMVYTRPVEKWVLHHPWNNGPYTTRGDTELSTVIFILYVLFAPPSRISPVRRPPSSSLANQVNTPRSFTGSLTVEVAVRKSPQLRHPEADAVPEGVEHEEVDRGAHREQQPQEAPHRDERSETFQVAQDWKNTRKH